MLGSVGETLNELRYGEGNYEANFMRYREQVHGAVQLGLFTVVIFVCLSCRREIFLPSTINNRIAASRPPGFPSLSLPTKTLAGFLNSVVERPAVVFEGQACANGTVPLDSSKTKITSENTVDGALGQFLHHLLRHPGYR